MAPKHLNQITIEISREDLYEQVWTTPINQLAETFGVSGSYLARVCEALNVPRPPVGYWQKKAVGKAAPLGDDKLAGAVFSALTEARMQVREHQFGWVANLIGSERIAACASLRRLAVREHRRNNFATSR
ncbi:hypothetical protein ABID58_007295 [Bradyrhizobium sp. S3.2.6]|uniref:hypothetical protein n=1 Tax=Bradyrhizobium sp. S3.2.6 TaxID=3156428 RepID=UPI0033981B5D